MKNNCRLCNEKTVNEFCSICEELFNFRFKLEGSQGNNFIHDFWKLVNLADTKNISTYSIKNIRDAMLKNVKEQAQIIEEKIKQEQSAKDLKTYSELVKKYE